MEKTLVSVVMAVYHVQSKNVLDEAIQSIVSQSFHNWELIICNDGDGEETQQWLEEWRERDQRIHLLRNGQNLGAAAARNACFSLARGAYIAVMDADDSCAPNRLEQQVLFLEKHKKYAFVGTIGRIFNKRPGDSDKTYWYVEQPQPRDFLMTLPFVHASILFRRQVLNSGYSTHRSVTRSEDYDLLMRLYAEGHRGANIQNTCYYIREDSNTFRRRKYRYRFCEMMVKLKGFYRLGLYPKGIPFALKPLVVGLIPYKELEKLKNKYYQTMR